MVKYIRDYYKILGINQYADKKTIKKAYKKAALKYHPDKNHRANAEKQFKLVKEAYIVLIDDKKRKNYDKLRNAALKNNNKKSKKNNSKNIKDAIDFASDLEDNYGIISKLFKTGSGAMKGKGLFSGTNLLLGGVMAGYGVKKGRDYMAKRGRKNE